MICDILFLYARDSEEIKDELLQELRGVPVRCVCINDPEFPHQVALKDFTKVKLQVVFFSPDFLKFLECRVQEAYDHFCNLDPQATVALFCCGLLEKMIFCYHTAPLMSYSSWPKYEHFPGLTNGSGFSPYFIGLFQEFLPDQNRKPENVEIVPELINEESSHVYIIFSNSVPNLEEISVHFDAVSKIQIAPECINEHVLYFNVPGTILDSCQSFEVVVKQLNRTIARKKLIVPAASNTGFRWKNALDMAKKMVIRSEEITASSNYNGSKKSSEESLCTISPQENLSSSLTDIYKGYELESPFGDEMNTSKPYFRKRDASDTQVNQLEDTDDTYGFQLPTELCRSVSLPSIITQQEKCCNHEPVYLPMIKTCRHIHNDLRFQPPNNTSLNDNSYVYMKFGGNIEDDFNVSQKSFGGFQGELMQALKNRTTYNGNEKSRIRRQNPIESSNSSGNDEQGENTFAGEDKRLETWRSKQEAGADAWTDNKRVSCSDSASSFNSKTSEISCYAYGESPKMVDESPTNASPHYNAGRMHPRTNGRRPPLRNEDSSLYRKKSHKMKVKPHPFRKFAERENNTKESEDNEKVESLIKVCERYGLQHLGDYFISGCQDNVEVLKDDRLPEIEEKEKFNIERFQITNEWDQDTSHSLQRSFSLPSTLFPTEPVILMDDNLDFYDDVRDPDDDDTTDSTSCSCGDYINSLPHGIYMSLVDDTNCDKPNNDEFHGESLKSINDPCSYPSGIYVSLIPIDPNEKVISNNLKNCTVSKSQEELLELMEAYKKGEKTISQVENQFNQWHNRQEAKPSNRGQHILHLRDEYVRAQKPTRSRFNFILRKPKPGRKDNKKTSYESGRSEKKKVGKTYSDSKRLSKASTASPSSGGTSENGDVFKWCYDNPGYGDTRVRRGNNFKPFCSPPPLPPRPPLTPIAVLRGHVFSQKSQSDVPENQKTPISSRSASPHTVKQKPSPPPKPPDVFNKLRCYKPADERENDQKTEDGNSLNVSDNRPNSPDYIIPNTVRRDALKRFYQNRPNAACPLHGPIQAVHFCPNGKDNPASSSCPTTLNRSKYHNKDDQKRTSWILQLKDAIPNRSAGIPMQLVRPKRVGMAKFYVTRRWSSSPKLNSLDLHTYLDLQELYDNRNRSISDSSNPAD